MKTKQFKLFILLGITTILFATSSCMLVVENGGLFGPSINGSRNIVSQNRSGAAFQTLLSNGSINVYVQQGNFYMMTVRTDDNLLPYLETQVINGVLTIGFRSNVNVSASVAEVYITVPFIQSMTINGSGNIVGQGNLNSDFLELNINGSGYIDLSGFTEQLRASISGSGNIRAWGLTARNADIRVIGSGNVEINVLRDLFASISGSGNIYYTGNPRLSTNINGSGRVLRR